MYSSAFHIIIWTNTYDVHPREFPLTISEVQTRILPVVDYLGFHLDLDLTWYQSKPLSHTWGVTKITWFTTSPKKKIDSILFFQLFKLPSQSVYLCNLLDSCWWKTWHVWIKKGARLRLVDQIQLVDVSPVFVQTLSLYRRDWLFCRLLPFPTDKEHFMAKARGEPARRMLRQRSNTFAIMSG